MNRQSDKSWEYNVIKHIFLRKWNDIRNVTQQFWTETDYKIICKNSILFIFCFQTSSGRTRKTSTCPKSGRTPFFAGWGQQFAWISKFRFWSNIGPWKAKATGTRTKKTGSGKLGKLFKILGENVTIQFQMANKIDMNMQSDLMAAFEGSL